MSALALEIHVSPRGDDKADGTASAPLATLDAAQAAVRRARQERPDEAIAVVVHGGTYRLERTWALGPVDSGEPGRPIVWRVAPGENAVISGGVRVVGWRLESAGLYSAPVTLDNFRQLWVNGRRARRPRGPAPANLSLWGRLEADVRQTGNPPGTTGTPGYVAGTLENISPAGYRTTDARVAVWRNPSDVEFGYYNSWTHMIAKVKTVRAEAGGAVIEMAQPGFFLCHRKGGTQAKMPDYVENVFEFLREPGQWYFDRAAKRVYYRPLADEDLAQAEVIAPGLERLLWVKGTLEQPVHDVRFEGLAFRHATWLRPSSDLGHPDLQANFIQPIDNSYFRPEGDRGWVPVNGEAVKSPANIAVTAGRRMVFERCSFAALGGAGLDLEDGSSDNLVEGCTFQDISGSGIQVGDIQREDHHPSEPRRVVRHNEIRNNRITRIGVEYTDSVGIFYGYTDGTIVTHNEIFDVPYSGVSGGWGWGQPDAGGGAYVGPVIYATPTAARKNRIEFNHVHHTNLLRDDGGLVYTLGRQSETVIRGNYLHDSNDHGIYLDEGSSEIEVTGNLLLADFKYNNGKQNRTASCEVHDNIVRMSTDGIRGHALKAGSMELSAEHAAGFDAPQFTVEAWVRPPALTRGRNSWLVRPSGNEYVDGNFGLFVDGSNVGACLDVGGGEGANYFVVTTTRAPLKPNAWIAVAMTYDGDSLRLYCGGDLAAETKVGRPRTTNDARLILAARTAELVNTSVDLDEVAFYSRALGSDEVRAHARSAALPDDSLGLVARWSFEDLPMQSEAQAIVSHAGLEPAYRDRSWPH